MCQKHRGADRIKIRCDDDQPVVHNIWRAVGWDCRMVAGDSAYLSPMFRAIADYQSVLV